MVAGRIGDGKTVGSMVRMHSDLRDRIKAAAENNGRSINSEIISALEEKYPKPEINLNEYSERLAEEFYSIEDTAERRAYVQKLDQALRDDPISDGKTVLSGARSVAGNLILNIRVIAPKKERAVGIIPKITRSTP